jgi:hypothetical protein
MLGRAPAVPLGNIVRLSYEVSLYMPHLNPNGPAQSTLLILSAFIAATTAEICLLCAIMVAPTVSSGCTVRQTARILLRTSRKYYGTLTLEWRCSNPENDEFRHDRNELILGADNVYMRLT